MERKIGEIFEFDGEWYQCAESEQDACTNCAFNPINGIGYNCSGSCAYKQVIFKKLEKVGEPMEFARGLYFQRYRLAYSTAFYEGDTRLFFNAPIKTFVYIELKQNKEDMKEKKLNLKPFSLELAKQGKPVCTRDGRKARIICFDLKNDEYPIVAAVGNDSSETLFSYTTNGEIADGIESDKDLMMLPEKKEGWVNVYRDCDGANITKDDNIYSSKDAAIASAKIIDRDNYVATTIIKWEE